MTRIKVDEARCKSCELCIGFCPKDVLAMSATINTGGYRVVEVAHPENCNSCGICALMCPEVALSVYREPRPARSRRA